jgi:hypothetical protein
MIVNRAKMFVSIFTLTIKMETELVLKKYFPFTQFVSDRFNQVTLHHFHHDW